MNKKIPDISHYHPVSDWPVVKENVDLLISKATQGLSYIDPTLDDFIDGCERYGIKYWLYAYLNKGNEIGQAKFLFNVCKNRVGENFMGFALDAEENNKSANIRAALEWLKLKGYPTMLYVGWSDIEMYRDLIDDLGETMWWEARYGINDGSFDKLRPCHEGVNLHQFTSNGTCPGIPGKIDLNRPVEWGEPDEPEPVPAGEAYSGVYPVFPDGRVCYKYGDGITRLTNYPTQIKRVQMLLKWITGEKLAIDGKYGAKTESACRKAQKIIGANSDGIFGTQTLRLSKNYRK